MAKEKRFCQRCGAIFVGIASAHFCHACRKLNRKEKLAISYKKYYEKNKHKKQNFYRYKYDYGKIPEKEPYVDPFLGCEKKYCSAYNPEEIECIKCYDNQIGAYKSCYKEGLKSK